jgi:hypothetical protein
MYRQPLSSNFDLTLAPEGEAQPGSIDRLGLPVPGDIRVQGWGGPRETAACAAGAKALAEADAAHAAENPAGV